MITLDLQCYITSELRSIGPYNSGWEIGLYIGSFIRIFRARAPLKWIARWLFDNYIRTKAINKESVRLSFTYRFSTTVNSKFFSNLNLGIKIILCD